LKNISVLLSLLVVCLLASGFSCAGKGFTNKRTIKCVFMVSDGEMKMYNDIVVAFTIKYPQYRVVPLFQDVESYDEVLAEFFSKNDVPDLVQINDYHDFSRRGLLLDLSQKISADSDISLDEFFPAARQMVEYQSTIVGLPVTLDTRVLYINRDKMRRAGINVPVEGWTFEQFIRVSKALSRIDQSNPSNSVYGFGMETDYAGMLPFILSTGWNVVDKAGVISFNSPKVSDLFQVFRDLATRDQIMLPGKFENAHSLYESFLSGKAAMVIAGRSLVPELKSRAGFNWDILPLPRVSETAYLIEGKVCAIPVKARNKAGAWRLLKFLLEEEGASIIMGSGNSIPPLKSLAYSGSFTNSGATNRHYSVFLREMESGKVDLLQTQQHGFSIIQQIEPSISSILSGRTNVSDGIGAIERTISDPETNSSSFQ
jgi:multiple sugar transport system substrate-binding protein